MTDNTIGEHCKRISLCFTYQCWWNVSWNCNTVFLNRRAAAQYRAMASIILGCERFSWNLSF